MTPKIPAHLLVSFTLFITGALFAAACQSSENKGKFFGAKETHYPSWFKESFLDFGEDISEANQSNKRIMIFFHQDGCPYCNALVERNLSQKDIVEKMQKYFDVIALNMWGDREITYVDGKKYSEKSLALALKVQFTPTLIFLDEQGNVVLRLNGYRSPDRFNVELDYVALKKEKETNPRDYIKTNLPVKAASKEMHSQPFFQATPNLPRKSGAKPLAIFFEQKECPDCDTLHEKVLPDKSIQELAKKFDVIQLDMWSKDPVTTIDGKSMPIREWAKALNVHFAPTIVVFNEEGKEVIRSEGLFKIFHTHHILKYVSSGGYKTEPSFQRFLSAEAEKIRETGKDVDIWRYLDETKGEKI